MAMTQDMHRPAEAPQMAGRSLPALPLWAAAAALAVCVCLAYANSLSGPFIFDDVDAIAGNPSIRDLTRPDRVLTPPRGTTAEGRPVLNLTFALDYARGGLSVPGYHVTNIAIHILAALTLLGVLSRTFKLPRLKPALGDLGLWPAAAATMLWALHPIQTESVTYIVQRAESLATLFYLLTLYCVIRGAAGSSLLWHAGAIGACAAGMATKEIVATAPLMALLYDRAMLAGTFRSAIRKRWGLYLCLAATWAIPVMLVSTRNGSAGIVEGVTPPDYALTQAGVILHYLRLAFWPSPLVFDYEWPTARALGDILPGAIVVMGLLTATAWGLIRNRPWAPAGAWFFLLLGPTSSFVPLGNMAFEHRMYGALAGIIVPLTAAVWILWDRLRRRMGLGRLAALAIPCAVFCLTSLAALGGTALRNRDYASALAIWRDTVNKRPMNHHAHMNLGRAYFLQGRYEPAREQCDAAIAIKPDNAVAYARRGMTYGAQGMYDRAVADCVKAIRMDPDCIEAYQSLIQWYLALAVDGNGALAPNADEFLDKAWGCVHELRKRGQEAPQELLRRLVMLNGVGSPKARPAPKVSP